MASSIERAAGSKKVRVPQPPLMLRKEHSERAVQCCRECRPARSSDASRPKARSLSAFLEDHQIALPLIRTECPQSIRDPEVSAWPSRTFRRVCFWADIRG